MATISRQTIQIEKQRRVIQATHGWASLHLAELWQYRELLYFLTWRDVKVRYKQAVLGVPGPCSSLSSRWSSSRSSSTSS